MQNMPDMWLTRPTCIVAPNPGSVCMIDLATDSPESFAVWDKADNWTRICAWVELMDSDGNTIYQKPEDGGKELKCELRRYMSKSDEGMMLPREKAPQFHVLIDSGQSFEKEPKFMQILLLADKTKSLYWKYVFDLGSDEHVEPESETIIWIQGSR